jgi:hypothetical protein
MLGVGGKLPSGARFGARVGEAPQGGSYRAEIDEEISTIFVVGFPDDMQVCSSLLYPIHSRLLD